jgi:hypothetical protein
LERRPKRWRGFWDSIAAPWQYLPHGFDVYVITEQIGEDDFELKGAYTHLPEGREWDGIDLHWPPGLGATQWELERDVTCRFIKTVPRGQRY